MKTISTLITLCCLGLCSPLIAKQPAKLPAVRIEAEGFKAPKSDIKKVLGSVTAELWQYFPNYKLEPIVIKRGKDGPIVLYERNRRKEIVVELDTDGAYWAQYCYQWAHEFSHILQGFNEKPGKNKWFEETLAELSSLYTLRAMSKTWKNNPPHKDWQSYSAEFKEYADEVIEEHKKVDLKTLAAYFRKHEAELVKLDTLTELNGAMAVAILPLFEAKPENWESIRYLNVTSGSKDLDFQGYLTKWHHDAPKKHRPFIEQLSKHFGINIRTK